MGASLSGMPGDLRDVVERAVPFLDEIDGEALSEAVLAPKPEIDPKPHAIFHGGVCFLSRNGKWVEVPIWLQ